MEWESTNSFKIDKRNTLHGLAQGRPWKLCYGGLQCKDCNHLPVEGENGSLFSIMEGYDSPSEAGNWLAVTRVLFKRGWSSVYLEIQLICPTFCDDPREWGCRSPIWTQQPGEGTCWGQHVNVSGPVHGSRQRKTRPRVAGLAQDLQQRF